MGGSYDALVGGAANDSVVAGAGNDVVKELTDAGLETKTEADQVADLVKGDETVNLPSGTQLAAKDSGVVSDAGGASQVSVSGTPIYAESANANQVKPPFGYRLTSANETDAKPEGSYYDPTANAWFSPSKEVTDILDSESIKADEDLFKDTAGKLDDTVEVTSGNDAAAVEQNPNLEEYIASFDPIKNLSFEELLALSNPSTTNDPMVGPQQPSDQATGSEADDTVTVTDGAAKDEITVEQNPNLDDFINSLDPYKNLSFEELLALSNAKTETGPVGPTQPADKEEVGDSGLVVIGSDEYGMPIYGTIDSVVDDSAVNLNNGKIDAPAYVGFNPDTDLGAGPESSVIRYDGPEVGNEGGSEGGGAAGDDTVLVTGGAGNDSIAGGENNDFDKDIIIDPRHAFNDKDDEVVIKGGGTNTSTGGGDGGEGLNCAPGFVPNEAGTACIPEVTITGGRGNDTVDTEIDTINGGNLNDTLPGGAGNDKTDDKEGGGLRLNFDPVKALEEFYNPFAPTPKATPSTSQTDTGPIQLMTDMFGTDISKAQKTGARGYGFSAGGDIDELLRLLRS